nr:hypothetical protein [Alphaproteobacteria bacterium]
MKIYLLDLFLDTLIVGIMMVTITWSLKKALIKQYSSQFFLAIVVAQCAIVYFLYRLLISYYNSFNNMTYIIVDTITIVALLACFIFFLKKGIEKQSASVKITGILAAMIVYFIFRFFTLYFDIFNLFGWQIVVFLEVVIDTLTIGVMLAFFTWVFTKYHAKPEGSLLNFSLNVGLQGVGAYFICRLFITY